MAKKKPESRPLFHVEQMLELRNPLCAESAGRLYEVASDAGGDTVNLWIGGRRDISYPMPAKMFKIRELPEP